MGNFDFYKNKYYILLFIIIISFFVLILKAFDFLIETPTVNNDLKNIKQEDVLEDDNKLSISTEEENAPNYLEEENADGDDIEGIIDDSKELLNSLVKKESTISPELEVIEPELPNEIELKDTNNKENKTVENNVFNELEIQKLVKNAEYDKALEEYNMYKDSSDVLVKEKCYRGIAGINAIKKHFGSALVYAKKAHNISPSPENKLLIARIYNKTGNQDLARQYLEEALKKDFR